MSFIKRIPSLIKTAFEQASAVHKETGRPTFFILCDMAFCIPLYGVAPDQYRHFGFARLSPKHRRGHMGLFHHARMKKRYNDIEHRQLFINKYYFCKVFSDLCCRDCFRSRTLTGEEYEKLGDKFVYKPLEGEAGDGVLVFRKADFADSAAALQKLRSLPSGIAEPFIFQHAELSRMYPEAVNPIRVATVFADGKCNFLYGTITLGREQEFANASKDALFALIDVDTGVVKTNGVDYSHNTYIQHPVTHQPIKGFKIPMWDEVRSMLCRAAARVPEMGYISWDIAITPEGPILIEGNSSGGYNAYQFHEFAAEGVDTETKKLIMPFLK